MSTVRETTAHLRFYHLLDAMMKGKNELINADVLLIGPGRITADHKKTYPQVDEVAQILNPAKSHLHVIDKNPAILKELQEDRAIITGSWSYFHLVNEPINPDDDISRLGKFLTTRIQQQAMLGSKMLEPKMWQWDPVKEDLPYSKVTLVYTHIIATYSAFFYSEPKDFVATCAKLVRLLKQNGTLYIEQVSLLPNVGNLKAVEELTGSRLTATCIPVVHRIKEKHLGRNSNYHEIGQFEPKYTKEDAQSQVLVGSHVTFDEYPICQRTDTCPVWALKREIKPIAELEVSFPQATSKDYWFYLAKCHFKPISPNSEKIIKREKEVGENSYFKTSSQGWTPLHVAVLAGNKFALQFFKTKGVPIDAKDNQEKTCLDYAELYRPDLVTAVQSA